MILNRKLLSGYFMPKINNELNTLYSSVQLLLKLNKSLHKNELNDEIVDEWIQSILDYLFERINTFRKKQKVKT